VKKIQKYWLFIVSTLFLASFLVYYNSTVNKDYRLIAKNFEIDFHSQEKKLDIYFENKFNLLKNKGLNFLGLNSKENTFNLHCYRNDSLIFWNTNKLPILRFADIHYPSNGLVKLQNGWYYAKTKSYGNVQIVVSFLIKSEYAYENDYLSNNFSENFDVPFEANIVLESENALPITAKDGNFVFAIFPLENQQLSDFESNILILLFFLFLVFLLFGIYKLFVSKKSVYLLSIGSLILVFHYFLLRLSAYDFLSETTFFQPSLYASSNWFPNLFIFCFNSILIFFYFSILSHVIKGIKKSKFNKFSTIFIYFLSFFYVFLIGYLYHSLVKDSSIPLEIEKLFRLNYYSIWASLCIGILFYSYFVLIRSIFISMINTSWRKTALVVIWFISGVSYFIFDIIFGSELLFLATWPLIVNGIIVLNVIRSNGKFSFNYGVILLFIFSTYISININTFYDKKERSERELFANQLATDQDISAELEFENIDKVISSDNYFKKIFLTNRKIGVSEFKDFMDRKFFIGFWERFDVDYYLFEGENALINHSNTNFTTPEYLENIIQRHSKVSEINAKVFYIKDYTSQLSYITKQLIYNEDSSRFLTLFSTLKSKRIPEKIGFPRLLISGEANVFKPIENYSIAKYYQGVLVSQNGPFSYPIKDVSLTTNVELASGYYNNEGYNHFLLRKNARDLIVLSKKLPNNFQVLTSFSYLFCFFGFFLLLIILIQNWENLSFSNFTLALKIQMILISIVVIALLAFGFGTGTFVGNQYNDYSTDLIKEKIRSVEVEVKNKLGNEKSLDIESQGDYMEFLLQKFAGVFVTDINLYDKNGYIFASSRPKIYNLGLISEQINPTAFEQLGDNNKSEFIHQENIGKLNYLSAYMPLFNKEGKFLAYVNLQHFGQQQDFQNQIEKFLVAIINVFILLLAFSIILSIIVSNWVTSPLKILQNNFEKIQLGKYNEPINYSSNDEIGSLVKNYNQKLEELAFTAQQLAISERETAWREMAKQVAHEIKNPLTPMKLSLQHLERVYDPNNPYSKERMHQVLQSVVDQVDALAKIANEFSNFAKMPKENKEKLDLLPILEKTMIVFSQENEIQINLFNLATNTTIFGDKDLIIRVFNNLIKNAIQSISEDKKGVIQVNIENISSKIQLSFEDNGRGIPEEMQGKIFMPNFTTKSTGTGLGLAMVKQIITLHEAEIWFDSNENGTIFYLSIPLYQN
jgi:signal transduction histidine kinase